MDRLISIILYWGGGTVVGMFAAVVVGAILNLVWPGVAGVVVLIGTAVGAVAGAVVLYRQDRSLREIGRRGAAAGAADLASGLTEVLEAEVYDAVLVEEFEDEGPSAFLDVRDGQVLALHGQWLRDYLDIQGTSDSEAEAADETGEHGEAAAAPLPCRRLRISRTPHAGIVFGLECLGESFEPARVREPLTAEEYWPDQVEVLPIQFDRLDAELRRLAQERNRPGWSI